MRVVISGGGTAGHAYPAIALASALSRRPEAPDLLYVGTASGIESRLAAEAHLRFEAIDSRGVDRSLKGLLAVLPLTRGFAQSVRLLRSYRPDVVAGTGGFVSAPVLMAARVLDIPTVLHEQNAVAGIVNRFFGRWARAVCLTFDESRTSLPRARTILTGDPVREAILHVPERSEACSELGLDPQRPVLLAFGGSRGAQHINKALVEAYIRWTTDAARLQILHVAGTIEFEETQAALAALGLVEGRPEHRVLPYLDAMETAYGCAELVLGRAGATTIAEVAICGLPALLVPYPYATEDHQAKNAAALEAAGAARVLKDSELSGETLVREIEALLARPEELQAMGQAALGWARPDAAEALAEQVVGAAVRA